MNHCLVVHEEMLLLHLCETPFGIHSLEGLIDISVAVAAALAAIACKVLICHQPLHFAKNIILLIIAATTPITQVDSIKLWLLNVESGFIERVIFVLLGWLERWEQIIITAIKIVGDANSAPPRA